MKRIIGLTICLYLACSSLALAGISFNSPSSGGISTASDCSSYTALGQLCQDTDDGKLYKGTGSGVEEIAVGSSLAASDIVGYTEDAAPTSDDIVITVNDPGGSAALRKVTRTNLFAPYLVQAGANNILTYTGNYTLGVTLTGNTTVTFPTSGTLLTTTGSAANLTSFPTLNQNTTGTAANLSGTPALPNGTTATTQSQADNSTKLATTAYVDTGLGGKQAADADLTTYAGITPAANVQSILSAANYAAINTLLGLTVGTDVQAYHAYLADIAGITAEQGDIIYFNGTNWTKLVHSTAGYLLQSGGHGANPSYTNSLSGLTFGGFTASKPVYSNGSGNLAVTTALESIVWDAAGMSVDGTQCAAPASAAMNSGPMMYTVTCTDNDAGSLYGNVVMPDQYDGGTVTFELTIADANASPANAVQGDVACMCRSSSDTVNSTWGDEIGLDFDLSSGYAQYDLAQATSAAVTCNGTCAAGDMLYWRYQVDAAGTTETMTGIRYLQVKMEYGITGAGD